MNVRFGATMFLLGVIVTLLASNFNDVSPDIVPDIDIIPSSAPFPTDVPRVLVIYESAEMAKLPASQIDVISGPKLRGWCQDHGWEFKSWDEEIPILQADEAWQRALNVERTDTPWMVFSNGQSGDSVPLPMSADDAIAKVQEHTK